MTAQYLTLNAKHRQYVGLLSSLADFTYVPGEAVDPGIILTDPNLSLYCLDDATQQAIFVELPPDVNITTAPFVYQALYEHATRLVAIPYATFAQLGGRLPAVKHLIMVYITGRSGSTLLSHIFNGLGTTSSLAEPDVATQFVHLRAVDGQRDVELQQLLDCTVRFLFKPTRWKAPTIYALKLRNEGLRITDLYQATFPDAKNLFLYRDAIGFVTSFARLFRQGGAPESMPTDEYITFWTGLFNHDFAQMVQYLDDGTSQVSIPQQLTLWWLAVMEWYLMQYDRGIPILGIRYDDLKGKPGEMLGAIFGYCGLPAAEVPELLSVFAQDSQAGTPAARENPTEGNQRRLSVQETDAITRIVGRHPRINNPFFVAPGTLQL